MTMEEWNRLHGYDENGKPVQRFVWEGTRSSAPPNNGRTGSRWVWLVDKEAKTTQRVRVAMHPEGDSWVADGIVGDINDIQKTFIAYRDEDYADVIKKAYTMCIVRWEVMTHREPNRTTSSSKGNELLLGERQAAV